MFTHGDVIKRKQKLTVDQDVKITFLVLNLVEKLLNLTLLGHIGCNGDDLASNVFAVGLLDGGEFVFCAARDVDFCSIDSESLCCL
jgi:hypothetical protein